MDASSRYRVAVVKLPKLNTEVNSPAHNYVKFTVYISKNYRDLF